MLARRIRDAGLCVLSFSLVAAAQDTPPEKPAQDAPPAQNPPAQETPPAPAGAPRHKSEVKLGDARVTIEHGQPPWSDDRIGQMAQIPVGLVWRMGSEGITTFTVSGAPVFFGDELIRPGRYGFNLLHAAETAWNFVIFDPIHEAQGSPQMMGDEKNHQIPTKFVSDAPESIPAMTIDLAGGGDTATCEMKWGPMRVAAPLTAVNVVRSDLELEGNAAVASWYQRTIRPDADPAAPMILGALEYSIDGENCAMNVYVQQDGENLVAVFRNQDRERWERENAGVDEQVKRFEALVQQFGPQAEAQVGPILSQLRRRKAKNEVLLEETVALPDNLKFTGSTEAIASASAGAPRLVCDVVKTRAGHTLEIFCGAKKALIRLDDSKFTLASSSG